MTRQARLIAGASVAAGVVHAAACRHLAGLDPIAALLGREGAGVVIAAIVVGAARLFLYFVAPAWAASFVAGRIAGALDRARSRP